MRSLSWPNAIPTPKFPRKRKPALIGGTEFVLSLAHKKTCGNYNYSVSRGFNFAFPCYFRDRSLNR